MITNTAEQLFSISFNPIIFDETSIDEARNIYEEYQEKKVITPDCVFSDDIWFTTNEYANVELSFEFDKDSYHWYQEIFQLSYKQFISYTKTFCISLFGRYALTSIQRFLLDIRHILKISPKKIFAANSSLKIMHPLLCSDFFLLIASLSDEAEDLNMLIDAMESYADITFSKNPKQQRRLANFETYLVFDEIIRNFWKNNSTEEERMFYYPLYLWWSITAILPMRPRDFLLTQRDCLSINQDNDYYLTLRRNQRKGTRKEKTTYKIQDDYFTSCFKIPEALGHEIENYIEKTKKFENTELDTLFITDIHYSKWEQKKHCNSRFFTYANMNTLLRYFYKEIITERYGYHIVASSTSKHLNEKDIGYIRLGDTRHIALINLMQEGGTPALAMYLAGHTNDTMASHYYSNIKEMIECKTYRQYRKMIAANVKYKIKASSQLPAPYHFEILSDNGKCYSTKYQNGDFSDCFSMIGENGEIGYCPDCIYYRRDGLSYFGADDIYAHKFQTDFHAIRDAVEIVRQGKGEYETIGEAVLKLQATSLSYEQYCKEKLRHTQEEQTWQDQNK